MTPKQRRERFDLLSQMGCVVCLIHHGVYTEPEVHHLRGGQWSGMGQRASDEHTIPLCQTHHRHGSKRTGDIGYHQSPQGFEGAYGSQAELLEIVNDYLRRAA